MTQPTQHPDPPLGSQWIFKGMSDIVYTVTGIDNDGAVNVSWRSVDFDNVLRTFVWSINRKTWNEVVQRLPISLDEWLDLI